MGWTSVFTQNRNGTIRQYHNLELSVQLYISMMRHKNWMDKVSGQMPDFQTPLPLQCTSWSSEPRKDGLLKIGLKTGRANTLQGDEDNNSTR